MDAPPAIVIVKTEHHDVRQEAIERVARQLCEADGRDCEANIQCSPPSGLISQCTLLGMQYPADRVWYAYRGRAEAMLKKAFATESTEAPTLSYEEFIRKFPNGVPRQ